MKQILIAISAFIILGSFTNRAGIDNVINALKTGNATEVAKYFDNTIEITMPDKSNSFSKSQAELILKDFFSANTIKGFEIIHKGENGGSQYCIGKLLTKTGTYRTTIFMKLRGNNQTLQEIRFEKQ